MNQIQNYFSVSYYYWNFPFSSELAHTALLCFRDCIDFLLLAILLIECKGNLNL